MKRIVCLSLLLICGLSFGGFLPAIYAYDKGTRVYDETGFYLTMMNFSSGQQKGEFKTALDSQDNMLRGSEDCPKVDDLGGVAVVNVSATINNNTVGPNNPIVFDEFKIFLDHDIKCSGNLSRIVFKGKVSEVSKSGELRTLKGTLTVQGAESTGIYKNATGSAVYTIYAVGRYNGSELWLVEGQAPSLVGRIKPASDPMQPPAQ